MHDIDVDGFTLLADSIHNASFKDHRNFIQIASFDEIVKTDGNRFATRTSD